MTKKHPITTTDAEIDAAIADAERSPVPYAEGVEYDAARDAIVVRVIMPGVVGPVTIPFERWRIQGLENAAPGSLKKMELEGGGTGIVWPKLGVAHYLPGLIDGVVGTSKWMAALNGRRGGQSTTPAKAEAARRNGVKGGRPPIVAHVHAGASSRSAQTQRPMAATQRIAAGGKPGKKSAQPRRPRTKG
jgi:hypothetical protein